MTIYRYGAWLGKWGGEGKGWGAARGSWGGTYESLGDRVGVCSSNIIVRRLEFVGVETVKSSEVFDYLTICGGGGS